MADVTLRKVIKRYDDVEAVRGIDLDIADHEFVVLVGPSGCGKSTTLRMIAGLEDITDGDIMIGGDVVNDVPPKDRDIAMVFQNYALYPHMTVAENMSFGLRLKHYPKAEITHFKYGSAQSVPFKTIRLAHEAMKIFYRKHYAGKYNGMFNQFVYLGITLRMYLVLVVNIFRSKKTVH